MVAEVNPGHRANPVKQFFHNPKFHRAIKITAVALAALAALAGVIALSVMIAPAFAALVIPVACVSLVLLGVANKRPKQRREVGLEPDVASEVVAAQRELNEAQREIELEQARLAERLAHEEAERKRQRTENKQALRRNMENTQNALLDPPRKNYRRMINSIKNSASTYENDVKSRQIFASQLADDIEALEKLYKLEAETGIPYDFASLDRETELADCLSKISRLTQAYIEGASEAAHQEFSSLLTTIQDFATKHHMDLDFAAAPSLEDSHPVEMSTAAPVPTTVKVWMSLHQVVQEGYGDDVAELDQKGHAIDERDAEGNTPLNLAVSKFLDRDLSTKNDLKEVQELREVLINKSTRFAVSAEGLSEMDRLKDVINALLRFGANPNLQNKARVSPVLRCDLLILELTEATQEKPSSWPERKGDKKG